MDRLNWLVAFALLLLLAVGSAHSADEDPTQCTVPLTAFCTPPVPEAGVPSWLSGAGPVWMCKRLAQGVFSWGWEFTTDAGGKAFTQHTNAVNGEMRCAGFTLQCAAAAGAVWNGLGNSQAGKLTVQVSSLDAPTTPGCWVPQNSNDGKGCAMVGEKDFASCGPDGKCYQTQINVKFSGLGCQPGVGPTVSSTGTSTLTVAQPPPKGKCPGEVNGATVWVPCSSTSEATTKTFTSSTPTTSTSTSDNTSTNVTTKTTTDVKCNGNLCTATTVVVTSGNGQQTATTSTKSGDKQGLCVDDSSLSICKDEGGFGGSCTPAGGTFNCDGDAVSCAVAKAVNESKCLMTAGADVIAEVEKMAAGTYAAAPTTTNKSVGQFNKTNPFSNQCPGDQTLSLMGVSVVIPLSHACSSLIIMGNLLVAFTLLGATIFVLKGLGGS